MATPVLTIRPADHTAGTAPKTTRLEVGPRQPEYIWIKVYDWEVRQYRLQHINAQQAWFWTDEWQLLEHQADDDLRHGRYNDFDSMDDFINTL